MLLSEIFREMAAWSAGYRDGYLGHQGRPVKPLAAYFTGLSEGLAARSRDVQADSLPASARRPWRPPGVYPDHPFGNHTRSRSYSLIERPSRPMLTRRMNKLGRKVPDSFPRHPGIIEWPASADIAPERQADSRRGPDTEEPDGAQGASHDPRRGVREPGVETAGGWLAGHHVSRRAELAAPCVGSSRGRDEHCYSTRSKF
jgi:hypothetical protein